MHEDAAHSSDSAEKATIRRRGWRRLGGVGWTAFLVEMASIVASVLLALWVSDWNEQRKEAARGEEAIAGIRRELDGNRTRLNESSNYYREIAATIDKLRESPSPDAPDRFTQLPGWRGIQAPLLTDDVFSAALSTQVLGSIEFDVVSNLSQAYGALRQCRTFHDRFLTDIYEGRVADLTSFRGRIRDLVSVSVGVERTVSRTIDMLDARRRPARTPSAPP
jgi:hypothetical protein